MTDNTDKFLEVEKQATEIVHQLQELQKEAVNYKNASASLNEVGNNLSNTITTFIPLIEEQRNLVKTLREVGADKLFDAIKKSTDDIENKIDKIFNTIEKSMHDLENKIDSLNTKVMRLYIFIYIVIILNAGLALALFVLKK